MLGSQGQSVALGMGEAQPQSDCMTNPEWGGLSRAGCCRGQGSFLRVPTVQSCQQRVC